MQREASHSQSDKIEIRPVTSRRELRTFITLPRLLYKNMKGFVAPFDMEQEGLLDPRKAAIFRHADIQYFLAWRGKTPVGRIAAILDQRAIEYWQTKIGQFGALDCVPDSLIVAALLQAAENWLIDRGAVRVRGPVTLSGNGETGCMVEGQETPPMVAMPWHPPQLSRLIEKNGYEKTEDLLSYSLEITPEIEEHFPVPGGMQIGKGRLKSITTRSLSKKEIVAQSEILRKLYNDAWAHKYNFVPMQDYEMQAMVKQIKPLLRPEHYVQIDQNGEPVAMAMVIPNIYDITADLGGAPSLSGWLRFAHRLFTHRFKSARVILLGVSSKLRGTILGSLLPSLAIRELMQRSKKQPYRWVELGWIQESDTGMRSLAEALVPHPHKRHRLYEKPLVKR
ncbi:hypothetical protein GT348_04050 [Aristophania vespae]|uniref:N-acetyltransferase domain-containing protein n=1 Tax=Aristophania vespae TaxID=2697033 RepID=A0A6P1NDF6_9PROT|nr:hypothetical protein [Aristophania vespae]QHI95548.1 hypothetical protein GT348_04050 [Aristophania vespae]UMM63204.1 Protein YghO [Aristophania vespae]